MTQEKACNLQLWHTLTCKTWPMVLFFMVLWQRLAFSPCEACSSQIKQSVRYTVCYYSLATQIAMLTLWAMMLGLCRVGCRFMRTTSPSFRWRNTWDTKNQRKHAPFFTQTKTPTELFLGKTRLQQKPTCPISNSESFAKFAHIRNCTTWKYIHRRSFWTYPPSLSQMIRPVCVLLLLNGLFISFMSPHITTKQYILKNFSTAVFMTTQLRQRILTLYFLNVGLTPFVQGHMHISHT